MDDIRVNFVPSRTDTTRIYTEILDKSPVSHGRAYFAYIVRTRSLKSQNWNAGGNPIDVEFNSIHIQYIFSEVENTRNKISLNLSETYFL